MKRALLCLIAAALCLISPALAEEILTLPDGLNRIEAEAFAGDLSISQVVVPEGVLSIGSRAFVGSGLIEITLPESLTQIADDVFEGCETVTAAVIENSYAHEWCKTNHNDYMLVMDYLYTLRDDQIVITAYTGTDADVVIPETIDGMPVVEIAARAFRGNTGLVSVSIPDSVTAIGYRTFEGCVNLESVRMPEALTSIGGECFNSCAKLAEIFIPDKVQFIGNGAFDGCTGLSRVYAEAGQNGATVISLYGIPFIDGRDATLRLFQYATDTGALSLGVSQYLGDGAEYTLPESIGDVTVTGIEADAFEGCETLTKVTLGEGVLTIGSRAFADSGLTEIVLPENLTEIADDAFDGCEGAAFSVVYGSYAHEWCAAKGFSVQFPATSEALFECTVSESGAYITGYTGSDPFVCVPESIGGAAVVNVSLRDNALVETLILPDGMTEIAGNAFENCAALTHVVIPDSVTKIGNWAFANCVSLLEIELPDGITEMEARVFYFCTALERVNLPAGMTSIPYGFLEECSSVTEFEIPDHIVKIETAALKKTGITSIDIPESVTEIGPHAFFGCEGLTEVTVPESVVIVDHDAFAKCTNLVSVSLPENLETLAQYAFWDCASLKELVIPEKVTAVEDWLFSGCTSLERVSIPADVTSIGQNAFYGCESLAEIDLPDGLTFIDCYAFYNCTGLTELSIPSTVITIEDHAFCGCTGLTELVIPEGVEELHHDVFSDCTSLRTVSLPTTLKLLISPLATGAHSSLTYTVIEGSHAHDWCVENELSIRVAAAASSFTYTESDGCATITGYTGASTLAILPTEIDGIPVTAIADGAFSGNTTLREVIIPGCIKTVGANAFSSSKINTVTVQAGVETIGDSAFQYCYSLTGISVGEGVKSIGADAFNNCQYLASVALPDSLASIGDRAFAFCYTLKSLCVPAGVTSIGANAFAACSNLVVTVTENSPAHDYCEANSVSFVLAE